MSGDDTSSIDRPLFRVVHGGEPTPAELTALIVVTMMRAGGTGEQPSRPASRWASRRDAMRRPLRPGPGAWAVSARP